MNAVATNPSHASLLVIALIAVLGLIVLIARFRLNSFIALVLASLFVGLCSGMGLADIGKSIQDGVGAVLGSIALVIGLGTILGKMLAESGGAERIATTLIGLFGPRRIHWAILVVAFVVGLPVFFSVGLVLLVPIVFSIARQTNESLLKLAIPLLAGLSVAHGLVPPHPGPMVAIGLLNADVGKTIFYSLLVGIPTAIVAGPVFGRWVARRVEVSSGGELARQLTREAAHKRAPGFGLTLFTILLPVLLMMLATALELSLPKESPSRAWGALIGHPVVALLIATLFSFYSLGVNCGFDRQQILKFSEECVGPVASVLLVVGAGGGFNRVLVNSGVGAAITGLTEGLPLSPLFLGWLVAALIRVATGSATVAISTAAGILAPVALASPAVSPELLVLAMGAGSLILSHVNDGGFWLVKEYFNLSVTQTLRSWTVMETLIAVAALVFLLLLDLIV